MSGTRVLVLAGIIVGLAACNEPQTKPEAPAVSTGQRPAGTAQSASESPPEKPKKKASTPEMEPNPSWPAEVTAQVETATKASFASLPTPANEMQWSLRAAPPYPDAWPLEGKPVGVSFYALAWTMGMPNISDGEYVAGPAFRITRAPDGSVTTTSLAKPDGDVDVQGVRPLTAEETELVGRSKELESALVEAATTGKMPDPDMLESIKRYYAHWASVSGASTEAIHAKHKRFVDWFSAK